MASNDDVYLVLTQWALKITEQFKQILCCLHWYLIFLKEYFHLTKKNIFSATRYIQSYQMVCNKINPI